MTVLMNDVRILVVVDENSKQIDACIEKLSEKIKGTLYLLYVKDTDFYPAELLLEFDKAFDRLKNKGLQILSKLAEKAKMCGFRTEILGVHYGIALERILKLEKQLNPDLILVGFECGLFRRLFLGDYLNDLLCKANTPILVAR
jgi:nucleotide-binding universal stress UspA family protein